VSINELKIETRQTKLTDSFGRLARKIRIFPTDRCSLRCIYCIPQGNVQWFKEEGVLTYQEIRRRAVIPRDVRIDKIRLTRGKPPLRAKLEDLVASLKRIQVIKSVDMKTNGLLLEDMDKRPKEAGLASLNISLDYLRVTRFKATTRTDAFEKIMVVLMERIV
jgi:GTP 3',8-cyclase